MTVTVALTVTVKERRGLAGEHERARARLRQVVDVHAAPHITHDRIGGQLGRAGLCRVDTDATLVEAIGGRDRAANPVVDDIRVCDPVLLIRVIVGPLYARARQGNTRTRVATAGRARQGNTRTCVATARRGNSRTRQETDTATAGHGRSQTQQQPDKAIAGHSNSQTRR
jgi:hypothetical protein